MARGGGSKSHHSSHSSRSHSHSSSHKSSYRSSSSSRSSSYKSTPSRSSYSRHSGSGYKSSYGSSYGSNYDNRYGTPVTRAKSGCLSGCVSMFLPVMAIFALVTAYAWHQVYGSIERSTIARDPLPANRCEAIEEWYQDDWGDWITEDTEDELIDGMEYFYDKTGVQPYLWIMGEEGAEYRSEGSLEELGEARYEELFGEDEGHLLVIFREYPNESGNYIETVTPGYDAESVVMDEQAEEILLDYLDYYYSDSSLSEAEFFSKAFRKSADRIMTKQMSRVGIITIITGAFILVIGLVIVAKIRKKRKIAVAEQKAKEARAQAEQAQAQANEAQTAFNRQVYEDELEKQNVAVICPNCGASGNKIRKGTVGHCEYCGSAIKVSLNGLVEVEGAREDDSSSSVSDYGDI